MQSVVEPFFFQNFPEAQQRFREYATSAGASLTYLPLPGKGPDDFPLSIDIAWLGNPAASKALIHSSGIHGVEGFVGSAIQLKLLKNLPLLPEDCALVLVHILNPYGMAWIRRTNENNVDLNRNCLAPGDSWEGVSPLYQQLNAFLNHASLPRLEWFAGQALRLIFRYGFSQIKQALAEGQYGFPHGLFYGGAALEIGPQLYQQWLEEHLPLLRQWIAIDVHTGLGKWAHEYIFVPQPTTEVSHFTQSWHRDFIFEPDQTTVGYQIRGGLATLFDKYRACGMFVIQELGTYSGIKVLKRMREENRLHQAGPPSNDHPVKQTFKQVFCPSSKQWRRFALEQGVFLAQQALQVLHISDPQQPPKKYLSPEK